MKQLTHQPLKGCRVPVATDDHWKSLGSGCDWHCHEWQKGTHIDSLPVEAPLELIEGPSSNVIRFE